MEGTGDDPLVAMVNMDRLNIHELTENDILYSLLWKISVTLMLIHLFYHAVWIVKVQAQ